MRRIPVSLVPIALLLSPAPAGAEAPPLVRVTEHVPGVRVALAYAGSSNAFGRRLYRGDVALLRRPVALRLARAQRWLAARGRGLLIWDAYRPTSAHRRMWRLKPDPRYVARPSRGSAHSRGAAVDVTLVALVSGEPLAMPTTFDHFGPRAHRGATRGVSARARRNARLLERAMRRAGFLPYAREWWHFTAPGWRRYPLADAPLPRGKPPVARPGVSAAGR